ncbi:Putative zinc-finger [Granulicella rosea]|uniref:Putative zinc-finger n=1 Tax=Granulicella rosea TaxID=474952 RepID=A0A239DH91_9BACT|nr:HEAT repeat domain-containing protein [Granulicella rosea]SNS31291.1 Putative zinc-finger [Granulicella rosea]
MNCEVARENIVLAAYGELPDELAVGLEQHLSTCEECVEEWQSLEAMGEALAFHPVLEPSPNLLAASRMRLDEALDAIEPHGFLTRLRGNMFAWLGHVQSAPALATLLVGLGFLGGNFTYRYQVAHQPKLPNAVVLSNPTTGTVANVSGIVQTPNSNIVQVSYNRVVEEKVQGSLDDPQIRQLLMLGTKAAANNGVRVDSVALLADECRAGKQCTGEDAGSGIRGALLVSLRYDKNPGVREKALEGLQPYIGQDQRVRDAVLDALMHDSNATVRTKAIGMLQPVQSDSSVRQVLRTVSTTDENPYIRTVSTQALQGSASIQ